MASKPTVGASLLLTACVALTGCQTAPPRNPNPQGYTQRQGSANPPQLMANPQPLQPNGLGAPVNTTATGGLGGVPTPAPTNTGAQFRSTAQPFAPINGSANPTSNLGSPAFAPTSSGPAFNPAPIPPPPNPSGPALPQ
jgi:hypothetical protein